MRALLDNSDFRNYFLSSVWFGLGIWAYLTAMGWTALQLTDSPFAVSMVSVVYFLPMFVLALPAGVAADRWDRKRNALVSRSGCGLVAVVTAALAYAGTLSYPLLLAASALVGLSVVTELAARQAYLAQIVMPDQLVNASALSAVQGGLARVVGPVLAGALIDRTGAGGGYAAFAVTNLLFVTFFTRIRTPGRVPGDRERRPVHELVDGFMYLRRHKDALAIVSLSVLTGMVGWLYLALMPVMARDVLGGSATTLGVLSTAVGLGSVPGGVALSFTRSSHFEGKLFVASMLVWGAGIVGFAYARWLPASAAALFVAGLGFGVQVILVRTILLRIVDPTYHGRVLGALMLTWGANIVGTLAGGSAADLLGVSHVIALSGALVVGLTLAVLTWNPRVARL